MPSSYRVQKPAEPQTPHIVSVKASPRPLPTSPASQRKRTTLEETYIVATTCRSKLAGEADRADHHLRLLVGHANMLDMLMEELLEVKRGEERRLNALIRAAPKPQQPRKVQWIDMIAQQLEESDDSDSDDGSNDEVTGDSRLRAAKSPLPKLGASYFAEDEELSDEDEADDDGDREGELTLRRWSSNTYVPELTFEGDSGSEDDDALASSQIKVCLSASFSPQCSIAAKASRDDDKPKVLAPAIVGHS